MGRTVVHTLGFNTPEMVEETIKLTVSQNTARPFDYVVAHLGFPLSDFNQQKVSEFGIAESKLINGVKIRECAHAHGAKMLTMKNRGVSPNWEQVRTYMEVKEGDVLICADPDERVEQDENKGPNNWVHAISDVIQADPRIAWCSLMMREQEPLLADPRWRWTEKIIAGHRVYIMHDYGFNWAQGGFSGTFLEKVGGVQAMEKAPIYGWIESAATRHFGKRWDFAILADIYVEHIASPPLYGEWKQWVCSPDVVNANGQITFEEWLLKNKV